MPRLVVAAGRRAMASNALTGSLTRRVEMVDDERHAVEVDDDGRPSSLTIASEAYEPKWLRLDQPWPESNMGACRACWYEYQRRQGLVR